MLPVFQWTVQPGGIQVEYRGEKINWAEFQKLENTEAFPDHIIFQFNGFPEYEAIAKSALLKDSAISLKL